MWSVSVNPALKKFIYSYSNTDRNEMAMCYCAVCRWRGGRFFHALAAGRWNRCHCRHCSGSHRGLSQKETIAHNISASVQPDVALNSLHAPVIGRKQRRDQQCHSEVDSTHWTDSRFHDKLRRLYVQFIHFFIILSTLYLTVFYLTLLDLPQCLCCSNSGV